MASWLIIVFTQLLLYTRSTDGDVIADDNGSASPSSSAFRESFQCLPDLPEKTRNLYFQDASKTLTIETSPRVSHRLISQVLSILLREVLGYEDVKVNYGHHGVNATDALNRFREFRSNSSSKIHAPETMVNLEVWLPAGFSMESPWEQQHHAVNAGPLGPIGRFGWYIPAGVVLDTWTKEATILDHWRAFKAGRITRRFSLQDQMGEDSILNFLTKQDLTKGTRFCKKNNGCNDGILETEACRDEGGCAMLLSSYPDLDDGLLEAQIQSLGLNVNVAWIGKHLSKFVERRGDKPTLFFNWEPNSLTSQGNYTRVKFPGCHQGALLSDVAGCEFYPHQLSKAMWSRLTTHAKAASKLISAIHLSQEQYEDLIRFHPNPEMASELDDLKIACDWINKSSDIWSRWIPTGLHNKTQIQLGGMFSTTGKKLRDGGSLLGAAMAIDVINSDDSILGNYDLTLLYSDTQCEPERAMKSFMEYVVNDTLNIAGIIGPGCDTTAEHIAAVSKHFNMIMVSHRADAITLSNRRDFPLFFRTRPQMKQHGSVYLNIFERFNWKQVALLSEDRETKYPEFHSYLEELFLAHGITVLAIRKLQSHADAVQVTQVLELFRKNNAKIIIFTSLEVTARAVICEAFKQGMTAANGYQWFFPDVYTETWWNTTKFNNISKPFKENVTCSVKEMKQAIQGHFFMKASPFGPSNSVIAGNLTVKQWKKHYNIVSQTFGYVDDDGFFATYAYDAVWTFALALDKLLSENPAYIESFRSRETRITLMNLLNATNFQGASGPVHFNGADREGIIDIYQYNLDLKPVLVGRFFPGRNLTESVVLNEKKVIWVSGNPPLDGRTAAQVCSIEMFRALLSVDCDTAIIIANILGVGLFFVFMVIALIVVKKRYDAKVRLTRERMQELGLLTDVNWLCLDEWEIPRGHVVLNRKLGEGAFGTVYGGEALIGDSWLGVAVKTLKVGSNAEEKLDFLSEAEMMKRFDHSNIVKLLGVCTRGEPSYTIMEFMLHGDLKTFLLARRQLAGKDLKEAEDITPWALTKMAHDISQGLQYLTEFKYVHRDLACRNCLVHATKIVKIGDFGMTRPMYDSDYYRFNKRGMLPVRWMAPESLSDGLFTPMSDIWSFGVLLYEIMTFGSFPYQGLSNKQVLDHVKKGGTINLPPHCSQELHYLLLYCWQYEPQSRIKIDEIICLLEKKPDLLLPCLDTPNSAVEMESNGSLQMSLPNRDRQSVTSHRLRMLGRTPSEQGQLNGSVSMDSRPLPSSPTSNSISDPFGMIERRYSAKRNSSHGDSCSRNRVGSEAEVESLFLPHKHLSKQTSISSSNGVDIQNDIHKLNCRNSDLNSEVDTGHDNSKDIWNVNGKSVGNGNAIGI